MIPISIHCYGLSQVEVVGGSRQCGFDSSARWRVMCGHQTLWLYQIAHVIVETRERAFNQLWKQCVSVLLRNEECVYMCVYCVWAESMGSDSCHCCFMIPVSHTVIDPQLGFELDQREDPTPSQEAHKSSAEFTRCFTLTFFSPRRDQTTDKWLCLQIWTYIHTDALRRYAEKKCINAKQSCRVRTRTPHRHWLMSFCCCCVAV